ncbi:hypothetical protein FRC05_009603 [Tulasnella sp. 425]|nr:hypothetical protein FRC05_009603 [Tulasnella sp. 425]
MTVLLAVLVATVTVSSLLALRDTVTGTSPKIVRISTIIQGDSDPVNIGSNTSNIIFRNLKLYKSKAPTDLVEIQASGNVWIDHNEFYYDMDNGKDYYGGACDINHGSDWVTVSWNYFHDHYKTSLGMLWTQDMALYKGHFHVTYHHSYFNHLGSHLPSLRFGTTHIYNNYNDITISGIDSHLGAQMLIENNVFVNAVKPLMTLEEGGYANPIVIR